MIIVISSDAAGEPAVSLANADDSAAFHLEARGVDAAGVATALARAGCRHGGRGRRVHRAGRRPQPGRWRRCRSRLGRALPGDAGLRGDEGLARRPRRRAGAHRVELTRRSPSAGRATSRDVAERDVAVEPRLLAAGRGRARRGCCAGSRRCRRRSTGAGTDTRISAMTPPSGLSAPASIAVGAGDQRRGPRPPRGRRCCRQLADRALRARGAAERHAAAARARRSSPLRPAACDEQPWRSPGGRSGSPATPAPLGRGRPPGRPGRPAAGTRRRWRSARRPPARPRRAPGPAARWRAGGAPSDAEAALVGQRGQRDPPARRRRRRPRGRPARGRR